MIKNLLIFGVLFLSSNLFAEAEKSADYKQGFNDGRIYERGVWEGKKSTTPSSSSTSNFKTSEQNREDKKYGIDLIFGADYFAYTQQFMLSKFIDKNNVVGLKSGFVEHTDGSRIDNQFNLAFQYKKFVSNSFYIAPEIFYVKKATVYRDNSNYNNDRSYTILGASFRIGNQWQWENFTIGCDWFGVGAPLATLQKRNREYGSGYAVYTLLNTYIGLSF